MYTSKLRVGSSSKSTKYSRTRYVPGIDTGKAYDSGGKADGSAKRAVFMTAWSPEVVPDICVGTLIASKEMPRGKYAVSASHTPVPLSDTWAPPQFILYTVRTNVCSPTPTVVVVVVVNGIAVVVGGAVVSVGATTVVAPLAVVVFVVDVVMTVVVDVDVVGIIVDAVWLRETILN